MRVSTLRLACAMEQIGVHGVERLHKKSHSSISGSPPDSESNTSPSPASTDPAKYPIGILVGWTAYDDPPQTPITARILGTALRPVFGKHLCSIRDDVAKAPKSFTFLGVSEEGKKLTEGPGAVNLSGWRVNWKKANRQPWTPWAPGITYKTPILAKETQKESAGKKHKHHKRSRSRSISSVSSDSSAEKDKHKRSRERREKRKHKDHSHDPDHAQDGSARPAKKGRTPHHNTHTHGTPNTVHSRVTAPTPPTYTDISNSETCITGLAKWS